MKFGLLSAFYRIPLISESIHNHLPANYSWMLVLPAVQKSMATARNKEKLEVICARNYLGTPLKIGTRCVYFQTRSLAIFQSLLFSVLFLFHHISQLSSCCSESLPCSVWWVSQPCKAVLQIRSLFVFFLVFYEAIFKMYSEGGGSVKALSCWMTSKWDHWQLKSWVPICIIKFCSSAELAFVDLTVDWAGSKNGTDLSLSHSSRHQRSSVAPLEHLSGAAALGLGMASLPSHSWVWEHGSTAQMAPWFFY